MNQISEYDIKLSELLIEPKNNYIKILQAVQEDKTEELHENIITYVDYFYAVDFIINKYHMRNKKLLRLLHNIEFQNVNNKKDLNLEFNKIETLYKKTKAIDELKQICLEILYTYNKMLDTNNNINIVHVVASYTAPKKALNKASQIIANPNNSMLNNSLIKFLLRNKKCDKKIIKNLYKRIKVSGILIPELIEHNKTPAKIINYYTNSELPYVRTLVAQNPKTNKNNLFKLVLDGNKLVRSAAYYNPNIPEEAKEAAIFAGGIFTFKEYTTVIQTENYLYY